VGFMSCRAVRLTLVLCLGLSMAFAGFLTSFVVAEPVERVVGVQVGAWVKYGGFLALWDSENPAAYPTLDILDINNTLSVVNTVLNVSGSAVTFDVSTRYRNGSVVSSVVEVDVRTGVGEGNLTFVSAGLVADDRVYTSGELAVARVNSTMLSGFAGVFRETNLLNVTQTSIGLESSSAYWAEYFWDRLTGVLVRQFWSLAFVDEEGYLTVASVEYELVDNNVWFGVSDSVVPVAVAGPDVAGEVGVAVGFDAGGSRDNVGIVNFAWSFGDGSTGTGLTAFHVYGKAGVYNVTLSVEDVGGNRVSDVLVVTVKEVSGGFLFVLPWFVPLVVFVVVLVLVLVWVRFRRRRR